MFADSSSAESLIVAIAAFSPNTACCSLCWQALSLREFLQRQCPPPTFSCFAAASAIAQNIIRGVFGAELSDKKA